MKRILKDYGRYILIFVFFLVIYEFLGFLNLYGDPLANYGFSYAISRGEVPYRDFNTIATPFYAFLMAIGLIFFNNYLIFVIEQCILVTIMFYFLFKLYGAKSYLLLFVICLFRFLGINSTYNFMALFFLVYLLYLEKNKSSNDIFIGVIIGLTFLSKHTIGTLLVLPSIIFYFKDKRKLFKRLVGFLIPILIFLIYLILTGSLYNFLDLCFFGLFDFTRKNGSMFNFYFIISILLFIISFLITLKRRSDITNYYLLMGISFVIPIFNLCHFSIYILCFVMQILPLINKYEKYVGKLAIVLSIVYSFLLGISFYLLVNPVFSKKLNHFQYTLNSKTDYVNSLVYYDIIDEYKNPLILSYAKMQYDISRDKAIDYFDVLLEGNYGYNGSKKMIDEIKKYHKRYVLLDRNSYDDGKDSEDSQFDLVVADYVINNAKFIESKEIFDIYYLE